MKKVWLFLLILLPFWSNAQQKPKLVVGIVVDQMRQEYLYRFESKYGDRGFKRLINEGFMLKNVHYNYIPTYTGPGHASIYTGATPADHGIIANNWFDRTKGDKIYCAFDESENTVGSNTKRGKMSPHNLLTTTITDELSLFTQGRSKVLGISIKDRGAIFPAGHRGNAYWYDSENGNFITSTYYGDELPKWVKKFNKRKLPDHYLKQTWNTTYPLEEYTESSPDHSIYEGAIGGKKTFPYDLSKLGKDYGVIPTTPFGNDLLTELTQSAIKGEQLGADDVTDFLCVSFSSTDYIGHKFGPNSEEIESTYIRLDKDIDKLLTFLDEEVGKGEYLLFLTADHGVADVPRFLIDKGVPAGYLEEVSATLKEKVQMKYGDANIIRNISNMQVFLDRQLVLDRGFDIRLVQQFVADQMMTFKGVAKSFAASTIAAGDFGEYGQKGKLIRGYDQSRSGDVLFVLRSDWFESQSANGTTHGSGYTYDTHVPLLWFGQGIRHGSSVRYHPITDVAPTLSMLLNIKLPSGASGQPIVELFEE